VGIEVTSFGLPIARGIVGKITPKTLENSPEGSVMAVSEHGKKAVEISALDQCTLELKQCVLSRIDIYSVYFRRVIEKVVESVTSSTRYDNDLALLV
jgi:hypothetical protein